jgi:putative ABC transport system ATP-binding protein
VTVASPPVQWAAQLLGGAKVHGRGEGAVRALDGITVGFEAGRFTAVMGPSGSGKSTLVQCAAGLDRLSAGQAWIGDVELGSLSEKRLTVLRRERIGFVFQHFNLVPSLTAAQNIAFPFTLAGTKPDGDWMARVVEAVGLTDRLGHLPSELSGGQQQRVAVARALVGRPAITFADEPTGNLDQRSSHEVLRLLRDAVDGGGQTVVMVTHDPAAATMADRVLFLADGRLVGEVLSPTLDRVVEAVSAAAAGR